MEHLFLFAIKTVLYPFMLYQSTEHTRESGESHRCEDEIKADKNKDDYENLSDLVIE